MSKQRFKYYAVKVGRIPGIYETWNECKEQVDSYKNAVFKGFNDFQPAEMWLSGKENLEPDLTTDVTKRAVAYVDGSYDKVKNYFSYGVVIFWNGKTYQFFAKMNSPDLVSMKNVAGEIKAAERAMQFCIENGITSLEIYHDYEGIAKWCTGFWKTNKTGTIAYKSFYDGVKSSVRIRFVKVKAHSGNKYNDLADQLAKRALYS